MRGRPSFLLHSENMSVRDYIHFCVFIRIECVFFLPPGIQSIEVSTADGNEVHYGIVYFIICGDLAEGDDSMEMCCQTSDLLEGYRGGLEGEQQSFESEDYLDNCSNLKVKAIRKVLS